jgi:hypothetical protein
MTWIRQWQRSVKRNLPTPVGPLMTHFPGILGQYGFIKPRIAAPLSEWQRGTHIDSMPKEPPQDYSPAIHLPRLVG